MKVDGLVVLVSFPFICSIHVDTVQQSQTKQLRNRLNLTGIHARRKVTLKFTQIWMKQKHKFIISEGCIRGLIQQCHCVKLGERYFLAGGNATCDRQAGRQAGTPWITRGRQHGLIRGIAPSVASRPQKSFHRIFPPPSAAGSNRRNFDFLLGRQLSLSLFAVGHDRKDSTLSCWRNNIMA